MTETVAAGVPAPVPLSRCHWCGYDLTDHPVPGMCPECNTECTPESCTRLRPWPSPFVICTRIGWPLLGLATCVAVSNTYDSTMAVILGYLFLVALPVNSYISVRRLLKRHLPEGKRTRGPIALWRGLGTAACIIAFIVVLIPAVVLGACLVAISTR